MAAIVRIKRRRDEDPQDLLLLSCKKLKSSDGIEKNENDDQRAVFKFAGTVSSKDAAVSKPVREAIRKEKLEKEFKQHQVNLYGDVRQKTRLESKESSEKSRYRVVSSHRALNLDNLDEVDDHVGEQPNTTQADESMKQLDKPNEGPMPSAENDARTCKLCGRVVYPSKQTTNKCECGSNLELSNEVKDNTTKRSVNDTKEQFCDREKKDCLKECDTKTEKSGKSCNKIDSGINMNGSSTTTTTTSASVSADNIGSAEADRKMFCLLDVETDFPSYQSVLNSLTTTDQITCNAEPMTRELAPERGSDEDYVYDLYYINNQDFDFRSLERGLTLEAMSEDCLYAGGLSDDDEFIYEDDDDENNENNWRNDYPDEDPGFVDNQDDDEDEFYGEGLHEIHAFDSGQDNQLADWMSWRCNIEDTNELSSDDDIERYEAGPSHSNEYYKYVRQAVNGAESGSEDETELPCL